MIKSLYLATQSLCFSIIMLLYQEKHVIFEIYTSMFANHLTTVIWRLSVELE